MFNSIINVSRTLSLSILLAFFMLLSFSCKQDVGPGGCETVVNADGPGFLKVTNDSGSTVDVYMGEFIPFGAEIKDGKCEIYGLPVKTDEIEFTRQSDGKVVYKMVAITDNDTVEITITSSFFN